MRIINSQFLQPHELASPITAALSSVPPCEKRRQVCAWEGNQQFNFIFKGKQEKKTHKKIKENSIMSKIKQTN